MSYTMLLLLLLLLLLLMMIETKPHNSMTDVTKYLPSVTKAIKEK